MKVASATLSAILLCSFGAVKSAKAQTATVDQGVDAVEVMKAAATVEKIDLQSRKVTLLLENGKKKTFKVDKSVQRESSPGFLLTAV